MQTRRTKKDFRFKDVRFCFTLPATLGDRGTTPYERLNSIEDLVRWLKELGFTILNQELSEDDLLLAKRLREAIQSAGEALAAGKQFKQKDLHEINTTAIAPPPVPQLSKDGHEMVWKVTELSAVLSMLSRDFIDLITGPSSANVKMCANPSCKGIFVDESRPKNRRWCSMQICGNQMKKSRIRKSN